MDGILEIEVYIPRRYSEDYSKVILRRFSEGGKLPEVKYKGEIPEDVENTIKLFSKFISLEKIVIKDYEIGAPLAYLRDCIYGIGISLKKPIEYKYGEEKIKVKELVFRIIYYLDVIEVELNRRRKICEARGEEFNREEILRKIIHSLTKRKDNVIKDDDRYIIKLKRSFYIEKEGKLIPVGFEEFKNYLKSYYNVA